jgi:hypothetical protein
MAMKYEGVERLAEPFPICAMSKPVLLIKNRAQFCIFVTPPNLI